jgi:methylmalonyl-CoA/ethylmalonyl-CoA epimerase
MRLSCKFAVVPEFRFDHVGIAVHSIKPALKLYKDALGGQLLMGGDGGPSWRWLQLRYPGGGKIELLEPRAEGFLTRFLERHGEGLHHITFLTDDIEAAVDQLQGDGFELVDVNLEDPHWKEAFLRPKKTHGTLVQIAQPSGSEEEAKERLQPSDVEELLS